MLENSYADSTQIGNLNVTHFWTHFKSMWYFTSSKWLHSLLERSEETCLHQGIKEKKQNKKAAALELHSL